MFAYGVAATIYDLRLILQGVILAWLFFNPSIATEQAAINMTGFPTKKRYWFVSVWLYLWIALFAFLFLKSCSDLTSHLHQVDRVTGFLASMNIFIPLLGMVSLIALVKWKKWGFFTQAIAAVMGLILSTYSVPISLATLSPLLFLTSVYVLLKVGKNNAWDQLA